MLVLYKGATLDFDALRSSRSLRLIMSASPSPSERRQSVEGNLKAPKDGVHVDQSEKGVGGDSAYDDDSVRPTALKRQLKNRHVAMIR